MKLKKIASLVLAGVMAVSMLAGCSNKGTENNGTNDQEQTTTASSLSSELRKALSNDAMRKVTAISNSKLDAALEDAVEKYFTNANYQSDRQADVTALVYADAPIYKDVVKTMDAITGFSGLNGDDTVAIKMYSVDSSVSDAYAVEKIADKIEAGIAALAKEGNKEDYKYDISASVVTRTREVFGTTVGVKYIAVAVSQNVTAID